MAYTPIRLSDSVNTFDISRGGDSKVNTIVLEYSTVCPFSPNSKYLLLIHQSYFALYKWDDISKYIYIQSLPLEVDSSSNPRWKSNETFLFIPKNARNELKEYSTVTGHISLVKKFEYAKLSMKGEADISDSHQFVSLIGDDKEIIIYDIINDKIKYKINVPASLDSISLTPYNNLVVASKTTDLFDTNGKFIKQLYPYNTHKDIMLDATGEEVIIHGNGNDRAPKSPQPAIISTRFSDLKQTLLWKHEWGRAHNISCPIGQSFFFVATYDDPEGEILKINLNGTVESILYHKSIKFPNNTYAYQPKVVCNRQGTKIVFISNLGQSLVANYADTYLVNLETVKQPEVTSQVFDGNRYGVKSERNLITVYKL